ncbi:GNAT family N-acetyltransferase [Limosilactobacillus equigenerosi]|uniref:N-acetyltransferase domain-containing protein n=1 Tax=Limosilactobacillus equigenerosi DSM 18793 = JCM 14505 TaxID=1423742 RepID=A0A0R1UXE9_9LACO|nr:GNAT family N-acetyltransferase [Limosilactobacillus equigenerosi]KRL96051.1 hypothetical protein FC21_GL000491 [Limosilactobacillus equigenerosi DSM 18793 = JCM 14505]
MEIQIQPFNQLTTTQLWQIYRLRATVFTGEQHIVVPDPDEADLIALHAQGRIKGELLTYARAFVNDDAIHLGRVVTAQDARGHGYAKQLLTQLIIQAQRQWPNLPITLDAQITAQGLYEKLGFQPVGDQFMEAGLPHQKMILP